jgi:hypothetical protein
LHPVEWRALWRSWADREQRDLETILAQERAANYRCLTLYCLWRNIHRAKGVRAISPDEMLKPNQRSEEANHARQFFEHIVNGRQSIGDAGNSNSW